MEFQGQREMWTPRGSSPLSYWPKRAWSWLCGVGLRSMSSAHLSNPLLLLTDLRARLPCLTRFRSPALLAFISCVVLFSGLTLVFTSQRAELLGHRDQAVRRGQEAVAAPTAEASPPSLMVNRAGGRAGLAAANSPWHNQLAEKMNQFISECPCAARKAHHQVRCRMTGAPLGPLGAHLPLGTACSLGNWTRHCEK